MNVIYKFTLSVISPTKIITNKYATVLDVQVQNGNLQMWMLCDTDEPQEERVFRTIPTGMEFDARGHGYIGTFQLQGGSFVGHVFELPKDSDSHVWRTSVSAEREESGSSERRVFSAMQGGVEHD